MAKLPASARAPMNTQKTTGFSRDTFKSIEDFIADNKHSQVKVQFGIDLLVRGMVLVTRGLAQQKSGGPVAPRHRSVPALAHRIPVQRITGAYYAGWRVQRVRQGHWAVINDTKEAYLIEYGIFQRVRRPILKVSLIGMLGFLQATRTGDRFLDWVLKPRKDEGGRFVAFGGRFGDTATIGGGRQYATFHGGSGSKRGAFVPRNVMAGPRHRLPG